MSGEIQIGELARQQQWRTAYAALVGPMIPPNGILKYLAKPFVWLVQLLGESLFGAPKDPTDLIVTIEAEFLHNFKERLGQISAPTLVVAGDKDPFYTVDLFRETAEGIPNAKTHPLQGDGASCLRKTIRPGCAGVFERWDDQRQLIDNSSKHRTNRCIAVAIQESGFESRRCQMLLKAIG